MSPWRPPGGESLQRHDVRGAYDRPGLAALIDYVRPGDTVVVWKLDRLGRTMIHILQTVRELSKRGVTLVSITDGIDSEGS